MNKLYFNSDIIRYAKRVSFYSYFFISSYVYKKKKDLDN